jgi:phosphopantothenoylcysteine decarboxylase/phosphopantothenate--cysteine ligase
MLNDKRILLIIGGGIAAFKSLDLMRRLRDEGATVVPVLTKAAEEFVTPLSVAALAAHKVHRDLFDLTSEAEMGHIELSRSADLVVVSPATADLLGKMANGLANDLASTILMATDKRVLVAPAMNVRMWQHPAVQRNIETLKSDGVLFVGPEEGNMACGEFGPGRLSEIPDIIGAVRNALNDEPLQKPLKGKQILVTSGPTHEPIDPVRYIANRSSGAQGTAIAVALRDLGADVIFITGPADVPPPTGVHVIKIETAREMKDAVDAALPVDAAVFAAAVADWRMAHENQSKIKKQNGALPELKFSENPDILAGVAQLKKNRPKLVVGFAAETDNVIENATSKLDGKGCDWIVANDVRPETGIMGGAENAVILISKGNADVWPRMGKAEVAQKLAARIVEALVGS